MSESTLKKPNGEKMKNKNSPFDIASRIFIENDVEIEGNEYMLTKILSFQKSTILFSIEANKFISQLPPWATKQLFNLGVKKQKNKPYLRYIKKGKQQSPQLIKKISQTFCCNQHHAKQIIDIVKLMKKDPAACFGLKQNQ